MDQKTIDSYNKHAKKYDEDTIDFWDRFPRTFLNKFIEVSSGKVLDIGSGPGRDGLLLKQAGLDVVCIDASEEMVRMSTERGLESIVGDLVSLPFGDSTFDAVWAYTSLLHIHKSEIGNSLKEIKRVLKPGGTFGLGMMEGDGEEYKVTSKVSEPRLFSYYSKAELEDLLRQFGFEVLYFEQFIPGSRNYFNFISKVQP